MSASVLAVHTNPAHDFSKLPMPSITVIEGIGVSGDAHAGTTDQHRSRAARNPNTPNLRQVHLIHAELFDHLDVEGFTVTPGSLGENITTRGVDLLGLPVGARLTFGEATVTITGLRNPCRQIDDLQPGLMKRLVSKDADGQVHRLAGVMGIASRGGVIRPGDAIDVELPPQPHHPLTTV